MAFVDMTWTGSVAALPEGLWVQLVGAIVSPTIGVTACLGSARAGWEDIVDLSDEMVVGLVGMKSSLVGAGASWDVVGTCGMALGPSEHAVGSFNPFGR